MNKADQNSSVSKPAFSGEKRITLGDHITAAKRKNKDGKCTSVYSVTNSRGFILSDTYFSKEVYSKELKTYRIVERNMIAYNPSRINVGSVALQDKAGEVVVSPLYVVFSVDERQLLPEYVVRFLKSKPGLSQIADRSIGTVRSNLKYDALCRMQISCPSLEKQRDHLEALNSIEKQIDSQKEAVSNLQTLVKSRFIEMFGELARNTFGYRMVKFCELGSWASGGTPARNNPSFFGGEIDWYSAGELNSLYLPASKERITYEAVTASSAKLFPAESLFVGMYDTAALKLGIATRQCSSNQACANLAPNKNVSLIWLYYAISQLRPFLLKQRSGCRQKNLSLKKIKDFDLPLPPLALQQEFAAFARQAAKLEFVAQKQIEKLQLLYDSLAQEYFG